MATECKQSNRMQIIADKKSQFKDVAVEYYQSPEAISIYGSGFAAQQAEMWRSGSYENKCIGCGGEDCVCCTFNLDGCKSTTQEILTWKQISIDQAQEKLNNLYDCEENAQSDEVEFDDEDDYDDDPYPINDEEKFYDDWLRGQQAIPEDEW